MSEINVGNMSERKTTENQYVIVLWEVGYRQLMSETLSVTLSETSRTEKRFGGDENNRYYKV